MDEAAIRRLLEQVRAGETSPDDAVDALRRLPYADLGFATVDHHRHVRQGMAEAIYGPGKTPEQCTRIVGELLAHGAGPVVLTRATDDQLKAVAAEHGPGHVLGRAVLYRAPAPYRQSGVMVVTAGTAGIGRATAHRFVAEGADVVVVSPFQAELDETVAALGPHAIPARGDASDLADLAALADLLRGLGRPVDVLFVNAGRDVPATAVVDTTAEQFDAVADLNFRGAFFTTKALVPLMRDGGTIVLTASIAGSNGGPGHAVYNATKAAVRSLARTLTAELRERRIRANATIVRQGDMAACIR